MSYKTRNKAYKGNNYKSFGNLSQQRLQEKISEKSKLVQEHRKKLNTPVTPYDKYKDYVKYQNDPVRFVEEVLGVAPWDKQKQVLERLNTPPYRLAVAASHSVGKSFIAACAVLWFGFCFPDSIVITTAPTQRQVEDILWRQVRSLNRINPTIFRGSSSPQYEITKSWFGKGFTPSTGDAFQGLHSKSGDMLIVFDEATGIPQEIFEAASGVDNDRVRWLCIANPTDVTSYYYQEWISGAWETMHISGAEHPNIAAALSGEEIPYPGAIQLDHWFTLLRKHSDKVEPLFKKDTDIEFPPGSGEFYRPGSFALSRLLGQWPITSGDSFFSETHIKRLLNQEFDDKKFGLKKSIEAFNKDNPFFDDLQVGVDIARQGQDFSAITVRYRNEIVNHYRLSGLDTVEFTAVLQDIIGELSHKYEIHELDIPIVLDSTGMGISIWDNLRTGSYNAIDINFSGRPNDKDLYANIRCELYASLADLVKDGKIIVSGDIVGEYGYLWRQQLMGQQYKFNRKGQFILIPKEQIKKSLGMSPDDADSLALACYPFTNRLSVSVS